MGTQLRFWGGCRRGKKQACQKTPPVTAPSQPHRGWLSSLCPHLPAGPRAPIPAGGAQPRLAAPAALGRSQPGPGGGQSGYFWPPRTASKSQQDAAFYSVSPSTAVLETPSSQDYVIAASKVPFLLGKTFLRLRAAPAAFSVFPNLRASPPCHGCPGRSRGCPSLRAALAAAPKPPMVRVTTWCPQNGTDKNSPRPLPRAGLRTAGPRKLSGAG